MSNIEPAPRGRRTYLVIDIETLPAAVDDPAWLAEDALSGQVAYSGPPSNYKNPELIAGHRRKWEEGQVADKEARRRRTSLDATMGHLLCVGWSVLTVDDHGVVTYDEPRTLWLSDPFPALGPSVEVGKLRRLRDDLASAVSGDDIDDFVGVIAHNAPFDLSFLSAAFIRAGVSVPSWLRDAARVAQRLTTHDGAASWRSPTVRVVDTADCPAAASGGRTYTSLRAASRLVGLPPATTPDGSKVYDLWLAGEALVIDAHCREDVARTAEVAARLHRAGWVTL